VVLSNEQQKFQGVTSFESAVLANPLETRLTKSSSTF
jgi:hypothetical protein